MANRTRIRGSRLLGYGMILAVLFCMAFFCAGPSEGWVLPQLAQQDAACDSEGVVEENAQSIFLDEGFCPESWLRDMSRLGSMNLRITDEVMPDGPILSIHLPPV